MFPLSSLIITSQIIYFKSQNKKQMSLNCRFPWWSKRASFPESFRFRPPEASKNDIFSGTTFPVRERIPKKPIFGRQGENTTSKTTEAVGNPSEILCNIYDIYFLLLSENAYYRHNHIQVLTVSLL